MGNEKKRGEILHNAKIWTFLYLLFFDILFSFILMFHSFIQAFIRGITAERFCVRNSGVIAVCEVRYWLLLLVLFILMPLKPSVKLEIWFYSWLPGLWQSNIQGLGAKWKVKRNTSGNFVCLLCCCRVLVITVVSTWREVWSLFWD